MVWRKLVGLFRKDEAPPPALQAQLDELRDYIARDLRGGYVDRDSIIDNALEVLELQPHGEDVLRANALRILDEEIAAYRLESADWPEVTDHDRLERAFAALESQGVVCRQNFTCCGTCGVAEIGAELDAAREHGGAVHGYAFFHMQDTERAVEGGGLWLNFGATDDGEAPALAVAGRIAEALRAAGLAVDWDGDWNKRIHVPLQWQRRLPL